MKKKETSTNDSKTKSETPRDLKDQAQDNDAVKKGYNEKNPTQQEGAFTPDAVDDKTNKKA